MDGGIGGFGGQQASVISLDDEMRAGLEAEEATYVAALVSLNARRRKTQIAAALRAIEQHTEA